MGAGPLFVIVATPVELPAVVDRWRWPLHVTVLGNFRVDAAVADAVRVRFDPVACDTQGFDVALGPTVLFGPERNVRVLIAEHPVFHALHHAFARGMETLPGFSANTPAFWGDGYRPHATLGRVVTATEGDRLPIRWLTLVSLDGRAGGRVSAARLERH